jgi:hypothetical protein
MSTDSEELKPDPLRDEEGEEEDFWKFQTRV